MLDLIIIISFLVVCYITGSINEKSHFKSLKEREIALYKKPYISFSKKILNNQQIIGTELVSGSVVVGCDYFKTFVAGLVNIFGGHISAYESVLDRGRREAVLRMREQANRLGANIVVNVKIETVILDPVSQSNNNPKVSVIAYGTAVKYDR